MVKIPLKLLLFLSLFLLLIAELGLATTRRAEAALGFAVNTTADSHDAAPGNGVCLDATGKCSLRAALEEAEASPTETTFTITLPAGTYTLVALGELAVAPNGNRTISISGAGAANTIIAQGDSTHRVLNIDASSAGGVSVKLAGLTISGGHDAADGLGGAGILAGSLSSTPPDSLTLQNCVVTNNHVSLPYTTAQPGGAIQMDGGSLTVTNCTFSNNSSGASWGGAIAFITPTVDGALTITGSTFSDNAMSNNSASGSTGGGALYINSTSASVHTISGTTFITNTVNSTSTGATFGGAILLNTGTLKIDHSNFTGNAASGTGGQGGAIYIDSGVLNLTTSRLSGNTASDRGGALYQHTANGASISAPENWWGCNSGPNAPGCDTAAQDSGGMTFTPYIVLSNSANPAAIYKGQFTTLTASFLQDSGGGTLTPAQVTALTGLPVTWSNPVLGTLANQQVAIQANGTATARFNAGLASGTGHADARVDNATVTASITISPGFRIFLPLIVK